MDGECILTNYEQARKNSTDLEHITQYIDVVLQIESIKTERVEMFNFKNKDGQQLFQQMSSESYEFSRCFENIYKSKYNLEKSHKISI